MRKLCLLFFASILFACTKQNEYREYNKTLLEISEKRKKEILNKEKKNLTVFGFEFAMSVKQYVKNLNRLIKNEEFTGGPASFNWKAKFSKYEEIRCSVKPEFIEDKLATIECTCRSENYNGAYILFIDEFKKLISDRYESYNFYLHKPDTKDVSFYWFKNGQEVELKTNEYYLEMNFKMLHLEKKRDSVKRIVDSLETVKSTLLF